MSAESYWGACRRLRSWISFVSLASAISSALSTIEFSIRLMRRNGCGRTSRNNSGSCRYWKVSPSVVVTLATSHATSNPDKGSTVCREVISAGEWTTTSPAKWQREPELEEQFQLMVTPHKLYMKCINRWWCRNTDHWSLQLYSYP